ncbi:gag/pol protein [Cucumis melo var. makuwa]|uniref:Gag/pol protein n=1 Tax=Cucumis melo var. makuwa TaxID=1194695 RepID=A0A5A7TJY7_CUCMM|nr:gag/pol protein [Cucumis melo var. makuwa]TYK06300.1 gag/pol protein [Cucumis melo var. makuwa]
MLNRTSREAYDQWVKANEKSRVYILASMSDVLTKKHEFLVTAKEIKDALRAMFGQPEWSLRHETIKYIYIKRMKEGTSVREHVLDMMMHFNIAGVNGGAIDEANQNGHRLRNCPNYLAEKKSEKEKQGLRAKIPLELIHSDLYGSMNIKAREGYEYFIIIRGMVSRYQSNPICDQWTTVKNILKYLIRTKDYILVYGSKNLILIGYIDSDFQTDKDARKSTLGLVFTLNGVAVVWRSTKQTCIADSTMEAEYVAACEATKGAVWLRKFLTDL